MNSSSDPSPFRDVSCHQGVNTNPLTLPYGQRWIKDQSLNKGYKAHTSIYRPETGLSSENRGTRTQANEL